MCDSPKIDLKIPNQIVYINFWREFELHINNIFKFPNYVYFTYCHKCKYALKEIAKKMVMGNQNMLTFKKFTKHISEERESRGDITVKVLNKEISLNKKTLIFQNTN